MPETGMQRQASAFEQRGLKDRLKDIQDVYLQDKRPWIIGYSGGKDSTATLQLVWQAIAALPKSKRGKPIHVLSSDTLVEAPGIVDHIDENLALIRRAAVSAGLPITATKVVPQTDQTFWVNLIGRGYPAPMQTFRWCTDRMKIKPADRFIMEKVSEHAEVIVTLGIRRGESMSRDQVMSLHKIKGTNLQRHSKFSNAYVYAPVEDWTVDDIWHYLLQVECPWGYDNEHLSALYRQADGECPLVVDTTTPSCGNSRFGCWTCTVVTKNKSMEAMIDKGENWMAPLLAYRDFLADTHRPERKHEVRSHRRLDGRVLTMTRGSTPGKVSRGPYKLDFCKELLQRLLETEREVHEARPDLDLELITLPELKEIRRQWRERRGDWNDSVPEIYGRVYPDREVHWPHDDIGSPSGLELDLIAQIAEEHGLPVRVLTKLVDTERQSQGMKRRHSIYKNLERTLNEDWRTEEEVLASVEAELEEQAEREQQRDMQVQE
jgi:DNA sulfur modification protein DndC